MATYQYQPLQDPRSIRVLELEPPSHNASTPRCALREVSLDSSPQYEAISYTWGSPDRTEPIDCEGHTLLVTKNCMQLLQYLRPKDGAARTLWIDAICINQESMDERSQQVQLMGEVYSKASRVLIWLGGANRYSSLAFSYLWKLSDRLAGRPEKINLSLFVEDLGNELKDMRFYSRHVLIKAITETIARPWFTRLWTIQELVLGTEVVVLCGEDSMPWEIFAFGNHMLYQAYQKHGDLFERQATDGFFKTGLKALDFAQFPSVYRLYCFRKAVTKKRGLPDTSSLPNPENIVDSPSFAFMLGDLHTKGTTDPKDKIFALYGIGQALQMPMPKPDYSMSTEAIYTDATRAAICHDQSLNLIDYVGDRGHMPDAPSWVPNWDSSLPIFTIPSGCFRATQDSTSTFYFSNEGRALTVSGIYVDRIVTRERSTDTFPSNTDLGQVDTTCLDMFRKLRGWYIQYVDYHQLLKTRDNSQTVYPSFEEPKDIFFRTIMLDGKGEDRELGSFRNHFEQWFRLIVVELQGNNDPTDEDLDMAMKQFLYGPDNFDGFNTDIDTAWFVTSVKLWNMTKAFFITDMGYVGSSMYELEVGDLLVLFAGLEVPYVVRRAEDMGEGCYTLIGPAYAHGIMYGQAWEGHTGPLEKFTLV